MTRSASIVVYGCINSINSDGVFFTKYRWTGSGLIVATASGSTDIPKVFLESSFPPKSWGQVRWACRPGRGPYGEVGDVPAGRNVGNVHGTVAT